jgi:phosphopantothenoylcysteine synthetase/decarboxylase
MSTRYYSQWMSGLEPLLDNHVALMVANPALVAFTEAKEAHSKLMRPRSSRREHFSLATHPNPKLIQPVGQSDQPT